MSKRFNFRGRDPIDKRLAAPPDKSKWRHVLTKEGVPLCGAPPGSVPDAVGWENICNVCAAKIYERVIK